jgi:lysophospholipase L1-like esterase
MTMFERWTGLARAGAAAAGVIFAGGLPACNNATDTSGDQPPPSMQMPVGTAGAGMMPAAAGSGAMIGGGMPGSAAGGAPAGNAGMAASSVPSAGAGGMDVSAAGAGGSAGSAAEAGSTEPAAGSGGSDAPAPMHEDLGMGDGKDVITIGDSWMNLILSGIEQSLEKISGRDYRNYSVPGTLVLNEQIPGQYESAKQENPTIKTVVMTGGGNDILSSSCADEACNPIVDDVAKRLSELYKEMANDGVQDVVVIGYTYPDDQTRHASLDHSRMLSATQCTTDASPRCHYIDSTMLDITLRDGIHPDDAGYDLIGKTVWELMQKEGMRR